jgi:hypothetical protein
MGYIWSGIIGMRLNKLNGRWIDKINETLAISKGWLCNRQGFPVKYDFRRSGAEAELEISSETRRA